MRHALKFSSGNQTPQHFTRRFGGQGCSLRLSCALESTKRHVGAVVQLSTCTSVVTPARLIGKPCHTVGLHALHCSTRAPNLPACARIVGPFHDPAFHEVWIAFWHKKIFAYLENYHFYYYLTFIGVTGNFFLIS